MFLQGVFFFLVTLFIQSRFDSFIIMFFHDFSRTWVYWFGTAGGPEIGRDDDDEDEDIDVIGERDRVMEGGGEDDLMQVRRLFKR